MTNENQIDLSFLECMTRDVLEASRVHPGCAIGDSAINTTGGTLIRPGGRDCYPAFWVRDFAMSLGSGLIPIDEQKHALICTAQCQQESDMLTQSGSLVPHGSIVDHISFSGVPIFFSGTLDDYQNQGGLFGKRPPYDDPYYFVEMAWHYIQAAHDADILMQEIKGKRLIDRLDLAFSVPPSREGSGLVYCDHENRGVTFGFYDSIIHAGDLLFCSILRYRAARRMMELHDALNNQAAAANYNGIASCIAKNMTGTFTSEGGLLRAGTGVSHQPDVWGSAFAVYVGAVAGEAAHTIGRVLAESYGQNTISYRGNIRHIRTNDDYSEHTAWEQTVYGDVRSKNRYQNGAYWGTPTGWVCYAIAQVDEMLALRLVSEYIDELREGDFRQGLQFGSPWECIHPERDYKQNPVYLTSVACPLEAFYRMNG